MSQLFGFTSLEEQSRDNNNILDAEEPPQVTNESGYESDSDESFGEEPFDHDEMVDYINSKTFKLHLQNGLKDLKTVSDEDNCHTDEYTVDDEVVMTVKTSLNLSDCIYRVFQGKRTLVPLCR